MNKHSNGFTLIELMVVIAVVAIITAIAVPSYSNYTTKARRNDAKAALTSISSAMERYHSVNNTFAGATLGAGGIYANQTPLDGATKYYNLSISSSAVNSYTVTATPIGAQTSDGLLSADSTGAKKWFGNDAGTGTAKHW